MTTLVFERQDVTLPEVIEYVEGLLKTDITQLDHESLRSNQIFSCLYKLKHIQDKKLRALIQVKNECEHERWLRYSGKASARHYKDDPLPEAILKGDIEKHMTVDKKMVVAREAVAEQDAICCFIEASLKQAGHRGFEIKNALEWKKMMKS